MCGRYIIVSKLKKIEKRFDLKPGHPELPFERNFNVSPGDKAPVITMESPRELNFYRFGLRPFWSKKPLYLINARAEGDHNKENDITYHGTMGLKDKPSFRKPYRSQRCLIPADAFIEGTTTEKLNKPFVVYPIDKNDRPFAFAGLYDHWVDEESGEVISSFCIITTTPSPLLQQLPHHRSPVCLDGREEESMWLDPSANVADLDQLLRRRADSRFNAYPIDSTIKNPRLKDISLIQPIGDRVLSEYDYEIHRDIQLEGMGMTTARKRRNEED